MNQSEPLDMSRVNSAWLAVQGRIGCPACDNEYCSTCEEICSEMEESLVSLRACLDAIKIKGDALTGATPTPQKDSTLPLPTGQTWIKTSERLPTEQDSCPDVGYTVYALYEGTFPCLPKWSVVARNTSWPYWMPIPALPVSSVATESTASVSPPKAEIPCIPSVEREAVSSELLPCPFCGGMGTKAPAHGWPVWTDCSKCLASGPKKLTAEEADRAWNRRLSTAAPRTAESVKEKDL